VLDTDLRVLYANRNFYETFQITARETIGNLVYDLGNHQWNIPALRTLLEEIIPERNLFNGYQVKHEFPSIGKRIMLLNARRIANLPQKQAMILLAIEDVTDERKKNEENQQESEDRFKYIFDNSVLGNSITRINGEMQVNKAFCELLGFSAKELQNTKWQDITHPDDIGVTQNEINDLLSGEKETAHFTKRYLKKDGSILWVEVHTSLRRNEEEKPLYLMTTLVDLTERKQSQKEIESLARFPSENPNPVLRIALDGTLLYINQAGINLLPRWHLKVGKAAPPKLRKVVTQSMKVEKSRLLNLKYGEWLYSFFISPIMAAGYTNLYGRDITEHFQAEKKLKIAFKDLERSNKELEQFAYVASHDLQEPLRMVASYTQLLEKRYKNKLDGDALDFINYAVAGANRMQRLINDLLSYSRVGTRGEPFKPVSSLAALGQARINLNAAIMENHALVTNDDLPEVLADGSQLVQLFQNLIGNAIKFHKPDEAPRVHVSAKKVSKNWVFSVHDDGIGIEPQYFERIFTIFQRLNPGEDYQGTGIGLSICKKIVERHAGKIWVESQPDQGSTFYFTLKNTDSKVKKP